MRKLAPALLLAGLVSALPATAVSLTATPPPQPMPADTLTARPIETWSAGSGALIPLMAADAQATRAAGVDAPAVKSAGAGKAAPVDDVAFFRQAMESGRKELSSARHALPQLRDARLKAMAETLVQDHTRANLKLSSLAEVKGWPMPDTGGEPTPPAGESASDFEQKWTAEMIAGHERSVALYRAQAQSGEDKDLRQFAHDTLPTIEHHLAELKKLQK